MSREVRILRMSDDVAARLGESRRATGRVHSVFEHAIDLEWTDGRLLALHGPGPLRAPFAAAVDRVEPLRSLEAGTPVGIEPRRLVTGAIVISWPRADVVECSVDGGADPAARPPLSLVGEDGRHSRSLDSASGLAARAELMAAIRGRDPARLAAGARALLGLGEGLTPSGDDCLVGALAIVHQVDGEWLRRDGSLLGALAGAARERTTAVGREFVLHALVGCFSEPVLAVLRAASPDELRRAVRSLAALGATSGADTLSGMRLACRSLGA